MSDGHTEIPKSGPERPARRRFAVGPALVYPLAGPAAVALTIAAPLAILGLFTLGPGGLLYYLFLAAWWLPALYKLFGPPFLLTGVLVGLAGVFFARRSIIEALIAAEFAFSVYFGIWLLIPGEVETLAPDYANISASLQGSPTAVLLVLAATAGCWLLTRAFEQRWTRAAPDPNSSARARRWESGGGVVAIVVGAAVLAAVFATSEPSPAMAWKGCTEGSYDDRIRGCTVILERGAKESTARRAIAHLRRGSAYDDLVQHSPRARADGFSRAMADYSAAISLAPELADTYARRGLVYARRREYDAVIADLDMAVRLDPNVLGQFDNHRVYRSRGLAYFHKGDHDRAIADHTEEIRLTPRYADGYLHRAAAHLAKGDADQAIIDFTEAIRIEPFRPTGYVERGSIYLSRGDSDRALADFDEATRRRPNDIVTAAAYRKRGIVLESRDNLSEALAAFEKALSLNSSDQEAREGAERIRAALSRQ